MLFAFVFSDFEQEHGKLQHASPYLAMNDNPVSFTDPLGLSDGQGGPQNRIIPDGQSSNGWTVEVRADRAWWDQGLDTKDPGQLMSYASNSIRSGGSPQTDWEKRNWNTYHDPLNGISDKSFDANTVWSKGDINKVNQSGTPWMDFAKSQLGVREATGNNDGPEVAKYLKTVGLRTGATSYWCGAFVNWSLSQSGIKGPINESSP